MRACRGAADGSFNPGDAEWLNVDSEALWFKSQLMHCSALESQLTPLRGGEISLVVQWLRLHLPMQGVWVQPLVRS